MHPLDLLSADEVRAAAQMIRRERATTESCWTRSAGICLDLRRWGWTWSRSARPARPLLDL